MTTKPPRKEYKMTQADLTDRYKRYLAEVYDGPRSLVDDLLAAGAAIYKGSK